MTYRAEIMPPLSPARAEDVGKFLGKYKIAIRELVVRDVFEDGSSHINDPTARTIQQTASATGSAVAIAPLAAGLVFPAIPALAALAVLVGDIFAMHENNRHMSDAVAVATRVDFDFSDVSAERLEWAETCLCIYAHHHDWKLSGLRYPALWAATAGTHVYRPWSESKGRSKAKTHAQPAVPPKRRPARAGKAGRLADWLDDLDD